jgi:diguanylate cyclase (GGDEF)-like protein
MMALGAVAIFLLALIVLDAPAPLAPGWPWQVLGVLVSVTLALCVGLAAFWRERQRSRYWHAVAQTEHSRRLAILAPGSGAAMPADGDLAALADAHRMAIAAAVALHEKLASMVETVEQYADVLKRQTAALASQPEGREPARSNTIIDPVTGTIAFTALMVRLETDVVLARQYQRPLAIAVLDVNSFRAINDQVGFRLGDELLAALADRLRSDLRESDLLARMGVDRFIVVWPDVGFSEAQTRLDRLLRVATHQSFVLTDPFNNLAEPHQVRVTLRAGLALCPDDGSSARALIEIAEQALQTHTRTPHVPTLPALPATAAPDQGDRPISVETPDPADEAQLVPLSYIDSMAQRHSSIQALTSALEAHDPDGIVHARNLAELAEETALLLGRPIEEARLVGLAALLHNVGNLGIPAEILAKDEPLTEEEWAFVRQHPHLGERLLTSVGGVLAAVAPIVAAQRERWDGTGYPAGMKGEQIPLGARIVALCDAYGAMISPRPYRSAVTSAEAIAELRAQAGKQFDPAVVESFIEAINR